MIQHSTSHDVHIRFCGNLFVGSNIYGEQTRGHEDISLFSLQIKKVV